MTVTLISVIIVGLIVGLYLRFPQLGRYPSGERLNRIKQSPNYKDGEFQNLSITPNFTEGNSVGSVVYDRLFKKVLRKQPTDTIPTQKNNLHSIPLDSNVLVWFGHSSYFIQVDKKRVLVDPVFSGNASPIPKTNNAFIGTEQYTVADLPDIDYLFITHDHYDHLDYETIIALKAKVKQVICGLGVGSHLEHWGYHSNMIIEKNWYEKALLDTGFIAYCEPARHFSGRDFYRNKTLWASFLLQTPSFKIYIGGDSGYDTHFADIGKKHGEIDLAILENGQYDNAWKLIHSHPEEVLKAAKDLNAKRILPVHSSKFALANHSWDEPLKIIMELNKKFNIPIMTPVIGETVNLNDHNYKFNQWWLNVE